MKAAGVVGETLAKRANALGVKVVQWSRPGKYHGKIKAFIDAVRDGGIQTLKSYPMNTSPGPKHQKQTLAEVVRLASEQEKEQRDKEEASKGADGQLRLAGFFL